MPTAQLIEATMQWVDEIVIKHNFCPFARHVRTPNKIRCTVAHGDTGNILETLFDEAKLLSGSDQIATTLLILGSTSMEDFDEYLDVLAIAERMLQDWGYSGIYQLASFHPQYVFDGNSDAAADNYTNRSPYPILHLIREDDISRYMTNENGAEKIFEQNIERAEALGCPYFEAKLMEMKKGKPKSATN